MIKIYILLIILLSSIIGIILIYKSCKRVKKDEKQTRQKGLISEEYQYDHEILLKYIPKTKVHFISDSSIPEIIHRTGPVIYSELTPEIKERHRKTQQKLGWNDTRYYTDADALIFLKEHFHEYVSEIFQCINHGAERADLLRYALLYIYGGLYLDLSVEIQKVPEELFTDDILLIEDRPQGENGENEGIQIAMLTAKPGEIVMLKALCQTIENIMKDSPSKITLERTGPTMFKKIVPDRPIPLYLHEQGNLILNRDNETIASRYGVTHRNIIRKHYSDDKKFYKIPYNSNRFNFLIGKNNLDEEPDHKEIHTDEIKPHIVLEFTDHVKENKIDNNYIKDLSNISEDNNIDLSGIRIVIGDSKSIDEVNIKRNDYVTKFRKIKDDGGILFPLNINRHWDTIKDLIPIGKKERKLFWRGASTGGHVGSQREKWCTALFDLGYDVGYSHIIYKRNHLKKYVKGTVNKKEFQKYLYLLSLEGNDVASGLVQSLSSNSIVLMPKPEKETYLGHSRLKAWEHYVPLDDPKNVGKILQKLDRNPTLVQTIIEKAHLYLMQFYTWDSIYQQGILNIALERTNNLPVKRLCLTYSSSIDNIPYSRIEMWKKVLPDGWDIELYGNKECRDFILEHYSVSEWNNFNTLANPVKSDYFRILYLYVKGGMYCDLESVPVVKSFDPYDFFQRGKLTTVKSTHKKEVNPMLMICTKRNLILEKCIDIYEKMFRENTSTDIVKMSPLFKKYPDLFYLPFQEKYYKDEHYVLNGKTKILLKIRGDEKMSWKKDIGLIVRSYNRLEYLQKMLDSLLKSDYLLTCERVLYDDGSSDPKMRGVFQQFRNNGFKVVRNPNMGNRKSMRPALDSLSKKCDLICYLDDDCIVKEDFIETLAKTYDAILEMTPAEYIILTGFNCVPPNCSHGIIKTHTISDISFHEKESIGGVNLFFARTLREFISKSWEEEKAKREKDWNVVDEFHKRGGHFFSTDPSVIQHIGKYGEHSNGTLDIAQDF